MSLGDNIWNGLTGHNVHTIRVSAEQLAAIINDAFIKNATSTEELNRIEHTVNARLTFRRMDSEDGRFHLYVSYFERGLTQHRYAFVKNYETEEVFEWRGFNLSPLKKAVAPYLLRARMNPSAASPVASGMSSDFSQYDNAVNNQGDIDFRPRDRSIKKYFAGFVAIALLAGLVSWGYQNRFFSDRVVGTWKSVWIENQYGMITINSIASYREEDISNYETILAFRSDGTVVSKDFEERNTYYWRKEGDRYHLYESKEARDVEDACISYTLEERDGKDVLVLDLENGNKLFFSDDENLEIDDSDFEHIKYMMGTLYGDSALDENNYGNSATSGSQSSSSGLGSSDYSIMNDEDEDYEDEDYEEETEEEDEEEYGGEYIFPDSDTSYLSKSDLKGMTKSQINLAKNELYARHGRMFQREDLQEYFDGCSWYTPEYTPEEWDEYGDSYFFNEYEIANRNLLNKQEKKK